MKSLLSSSPCESISSSAVRDRVVTVHLQITLSSPEWDAAEALAIIEQSGLPEKLSYLLATESPKTMVEALHDRDGRCAGDIVFRLARHTGKSAPARCHPIHSRAGLNQT